MISEKSGLTISSKIPRLHPRSYFEPPVVVHANLAPDNLIQIGAFTGVYGGRLGHCKIGRYCSIAPGVDIASDQHPIDWFSSSMFQYVPNLHNWGTWLTSQGYTYHEPKTKFDSNSQVIIGNDVWIGQGVFIKSGVSIGDGAIIAAHSVVINDIPPYAIAAGVPAKVKRFRFSDDLIEKFLKIKWWDYQIIGQPEIDFSSPEMAIEKLEALIKTQKLNKYIIDNHKFDEI